MATLRLSSADVEPLPVLLLQTFHDALSPSASPAAVSTAGACVGVATVAGAFAVAFLFMDKRLDDCAFHASPPLLTALALCVSCFVCALGLQGTRQQ
jgi:hypothetical protein